MPDTATRKPRTPAKPPTGIQEFTAESMAVCLLGAVSMRAAGFLIGKSKRFVWDLIKDGRLRGTFMHGRDRVVPMTSIQMYLAEVRDAGLAHR